MKKPPRISAGRFVFYYQTWSQWNFLAFTALEPMAVGKGQKTDSLTARSRCARDKPRASR